jgi:hypothetical protein
LSSLSVDPEGPQGRATRADWRVVLLLAVVALAARAQTFGNPVIGFDEQFYLVVGDRMLHGALPFVDIFDRKPIGLFLIFAGVRLLGGEGTIQYQIVAGLFALATAVLVHRAARRVAPPAGAVAAAVAYLLWLDFLEGEGGQAPVFFNLPMIVAAMLTARAWRSNGRGLTALGCAAMLVTGVAIQIKYTALFEGVFFGLAMLWTGWRAQVGHVRLAGMAALWVGAALLPTAAAWLAYAAMGHGQEFLFANFLSMFGKLPDDTATKVLGLATIVAILSPLLVMASCPPPPADTEAAHERRFVQLWLLAAIAGFLAFGSFSTPQYAMPVLVPAVVAAAARLGVLRWGRASRWGLLAVAFVAGQVVLASLRVNKGGRAEAMAVAAAARPHRGCLYVFDGYPALYRLTHTCLVSRFVFPGHLNMANEASIKALGVDPSAEVERIMAAGPETVVDEWPVFERGNDATHAIVLHSLARDYRLVLRQPTGPHRFRLVYRRLSPDRPPAPR